MIARCTLVRVNTLLVGSATDRGKAKDPATTYAQELGLLSYPDARLDKGGAETILPVFQFMLPF